MKNELRTARIEFSIFHFPFVSLIVVELEISWNWNFDGLSSKLQFGIKNATKNGFLKFPSMRLWIGVQYCSSGFQMRC